MTTYKITQRDIDSKTKDTTALLDGILKKAQSCCDEALIEFEKGEYHFYKDTAVKETYYTSNTNADRFPIKSVAINIKNQKNLTIDGNGSLFIMHGDMMAVAVVESENISLKNFSWDFPCSTVFEMHVLSSGLFHADYFIPEACEYSIDGKNLHWFETSPITGKKYWEHINHEKSWVFVAVDPVTGNSCRYPVNLGPMFMARKIEKTGERTLRIHYFKKTPRVYRKDMIFEMCTDKIRECTGGFACESKNVSLEDINIHFMHGFGFLIQMSEDVSFNRCNFVPREGTDRHTTSYADLIHASGAKGKIKIENCKFSNAHDDPINIHGTYTRVKSQNDEHTLTLEYVHNQQNGFVQYHVGDKVIFYARNNLEAAENGKEFTVARVVNPLENGNSVKEMTVTFEESIPSYVGVDRKYVAENITYTPEVYIAGNSFYTIPTRGILCTTGKKVVIENNTFDGMTMASIYLSNDCNVWYESGPIKDMTIRNNIFYVKRAMRKATWRKGAIFIDPIVKSIGLGENPVHKNITIEGNTFYMEHENVILAKATENLTFKNNKVEKLDSKNSDKKIKAFAFSGCKNIVIENNTFGKDIDAEY